MNITDKITITNEDCMELLNRTPDKFYDLALVDPPYGIGAGGKSFRNGTSKNKDIGFKDIDWDISIPSNEYFEELKRVSKNQIIWGGNYFAKNLENSQCWIFWDKGTGDNSYADGELAWTSFNSSIRMYKKSWVGANAKDYFGRVHPTQKPVDLYKWLLDKYAKQGDKILDTHLGSGSIAIAAHDYGFELTACELDFDYYNKAVERIKRHTNQLKMF